MSIIIIIIMSVCLVPLVPLVSCSAETPDEENLNPEVTAAGFHFRPKVPYSLIQNDPVQSEPFPVQFRPEVMNIWLICC